MRISDWSSDVCSSDLVGQPRSRAGGHAYARRLRPPQQPARQHRQRDADERLSLRLAQALAQRAPVDARVDQHRHRAGLERSEEHTSELQSLMRISYAVFCLKKKTYNNTNKLVSIT